MAIQVGVSPRSMRRILKNKLKTKPFKTQKLQDLNDNQKATRMERARKLKADTAKVGCRTLCLRMRKFSSWNYMSTSKMIGYGLRAKTKIMRTGFVQKGNTQRLQSWCGPESVELGELPLLLFRRG